MRVRPLASLLCGMALIGALGMGPVALADGQSLTTNIVPQNNSGISGTATLTDLGNGKLKVDIHLTGAGAGPEPAHIHEGVCMPNMDMQMGQQPPPEESLTPVINGVSTSEVNVPFQKVTTSSYTILIHKSPEEIGDVVACATIGQPMALPDTGGGAEGARPDGWPILGALISAAGLALLSERRRRGVR